MRTEASRSRPTERSHPTRRCGSRGSASRGTRRPTAEGLRLNAGGYYARIPGLNLAIARSTNGSLGQTRFGSNVFGIPVPAYDSLLPPTTGTPFVPDVYVFDRHFQNPRTINLTVGYERQLASDLAASISYTHARGDHLTRFINRNDAAFGNPFGSIAN